MGWWSSSTWRSRPQGDCGPRPWLPTATTVVMPRATLGARGSEGHELRAGPAGEVVEVHSDEGAPVLGPDRGTHGVDAVLVESRIGVGVNAAPGQLDHLELASVELTRGAQQGVHRHSMSNNHHGVRGTHTCE